MSEATDDGTVEVGLLLKGGMRRLLAELKWEGHVADYFERKSLLDSTFLLRGVTPYGSKVIKAWVREFGDGR